MDKKLTGETLLVVEEKEQGKQCVKAVTGEFDKDGNPKTVSPTDKNNPDFLKIDKHGNVLENFFSNFNGQCKNPTEFMFFKVPIDGIEALATVIGDILKEGYESGKDLLEEYRVKAEGYPKLVQKQEKNPDAPSKKQEKTSEMESEFKQTAVAENEVNWEELKKLGISKEMLKQKKCLNTLLNFGKTPLLPVKMDLQGISIDTQARLNLRKSSERKISFAVHGIRKQPEVDKPFYGHKFTDEEKQALLKTGNLGKTIDLKKADGTKLPIYVSIDKLTNEVVGLRVEKIKIPDEIKGVALDDKQKEALKEGKAVFIEGMTSKKGTEFSAHLQVNAEKRGLEFKFNNRHKQNHQERQEVRIPQKLGGMELTKEQQADLKAEKTIYVSGLTDKRGQVYNAYIKVNNEKGKLDFFKWNPDKAQEKTPDNAHKIQEAVNSQGKTNEVTKDIKEPLKKEQTQLKAGQKPQTKRTTKSKGVKV